jgi:hypothetical protein
MSFTFLLAGASASLSELARARLDGTFDDGLEDFALALACRVGRVLVVVAVSVVVFFLGGML